jgi:hypothetical protein
MQNFSETSRGWIFGLAGAVFVAAALKISLLVADVVPFNADEAIIALMAKHILHGERPIFFYGQAYMGSLDAYLVALVFKLFGIHVWGVRLVQIVFYSLTIGTTALLGKNLTGKWKVGVLVAWFLAVPNISTTLYTTVSLGGYGEMLLIGNLIFLITLRVVRDISSEQDKVSIIPWFGLGLLSGFGLWVFGLTLVYTIPAFTYLAWYWIRSKQSDLLGNKSLSWRKLLAIRIEGDEYSAPVTQSRLWSVAFLGLALGAIPWWVYAQQAGLSKLLFELGGGAISGVESLNLLGQIYHHILNLGLFGSTVMFGLRPPWEIRWLALPLAPLVLIFWIGVLVYAYKQTLSELFLDPRDEKFSHSPLLSGVILMVLVGFVLSPFGADPSGRYFLPVGVIMALFAAQAVWKWQAKWGRYIWGVVSLVLIFHIWGTVQVGRINPPGITTQFDAVTQIDHSYDQELIDFLRDQGEFRGYTNYWIAYPLAFHSDEDLVFIPRLPYHQDLRYTPRDDRYEAYDRIIDQSDRVAYITTNNPMLDEQLRLGFSNLGATWEEVEIGNYLVFYRLSQRVDPEEIGLGGGEG